MKLRSVFINAENLATKIKFWIRLEIYGSSTHSRLLLATIWDWNSQNWIGNRLVSRLFLEEPLETIIKKIIGVDSPLIVGIV